MRDLKVKKQTINSKITILCIILGLMEPLGISGAAKYLGSFWVYLDYVAVLCMYLSFAIGGYYTLLNLKRTKKLDTIELIFLLFEVVLLFSDVINDAALMTDIRYFLSAWTLIQVFKYAIDRNVIDEMISTFILVNGIFIILNLLVIIFYNEGLYYDDRGWGTNYLLGYRNLNIYTYLPFICFFGLKHRSRKRNVSLQFFLYMLIITASIFLSGSSTSLAIIAIIWFGVFFFAKREIPKYLNPAAVFLYSLVLSGLFIFFQFQNQFGELISYLFGKDSSFSRRIYIWSTALLRIGQHPIIGNGNSSFSWGSYFDVAQCHNRYLDILYMGGITLLVLFLCMLIVSTMRSSKNVGMNLFVFSFWGYAILFLMEGRRPDYVFYLLLYLYWNLNRKEMS